MFLIFFVGLFIFIHLIHFFFGVNSFHHHAFYFSVALLLVRHVIIGKKSLYKLVTALKLKQKRIKMYFETVYIIKRKAENPRKS